MLQKPFAPKSQNGPGTWHRKKQPAPENPAQGITPLLRKDHSPEGHLQTID